jgi:hypothetical protein
MWAASIQRASSRSRDWGARLALVEYLYNDAVRVLPLVYALNRVWPPSSKRLADRVGTLPVMPERLAARIDEALTETDMLRAMLVTTEVQIDTIDLAPPGPNVDRACRWLPDVARVLREASLSQEEQPTITSLAACARGFAGAGAADARFEC